MKNDPAMNFLVLAAGVLLLFLGVRVFDRVIHAFDGHLRRDTMLRAAGGLILVVAGLYVIVRW
ncbi:MAG: hypothetical protein HZB26_01995 [Candidatus Hydrogenedentes bacterium]|nr:hypothetical protein [Candidatus Hydrogenedentota bacterium]